jgi:hypothetical protein
MVQRLGCAVAGHLLIVQEDLVPMWACEALLVDVVLRLAVCQPQQAGSHACCGSERVKAIRCSILHASFLCNAVWAVQAADGPLLLLLLSCEQYVLLSHGPSPWCSLRACKHIKMSSQW